MQLHTVTHTVLKEPWLHRRKVVYRKRTYHVIYDTEAEALAFASRDPENRHYSLRAWTPKDKATSNIIDNRKT